MFDNTDLYQVKQRHVQELIRHASQQQHRRLIEDVMRLGSTVKRATSLLLTFELPIFLSRTLEAPSMVACQNR